ncbi:hypothetical protein B7463_g9148, partial [Scytalidium lignicola]
MIRQSDDIVSTIRAPLTIRPIIMDSVDLVLKRPHEKTLEEQPRKRARQSCEACKRPFYRVSEEVYESSIKLLRRFVSEEELPELTVENIQAALVRLDDGHLIPPSREIPQVFPMESDHSDVDQVLDDSNESHEMMERDEHPLLQEELGCMILDSMGKYRYVGADSSIRWNHAARMASDTSVHADPKVILPLRTGLLPPATPESAIANHVERYFPCRQLCMRYVERFFNQIHCLYWFYPPEQFYTALDHTLEDRGTTASYSWLCSLYSIFALGSMAPRDQMVDLNSTTPWDNKYATDYLAMAKDLSLRAGDEADIESVRAFALLSLANHAMCYSVAAYLYLGTAVRVGLTLGLHRDVSFRANDSLERERGRRIWWTIYVLDHEMAIRFGYPCAIVDDPTFMKTSSALEQADPGPNMPLSYQALSVALTRLRKKISHECFLEPAHVGGRLPISRVTQSLSALKKWSDSVPAYLDWDSSLPPQHQRSVAILHLRYWTSIISVTRPFLLFTISNTAPITVPAKKKCYQELSDTCIEAAERSVQIIKRMREDETLSSLILLDCHCIGEVMWILILALQKLGRIEHQGMLGFCLETVTEMEKIGWSEKVTPEFEARIHESGVLESVLLQQPEMQHNPPDSLHQQQNTDANAGMLPQPQFSRSYLDYMDFNFEGSQFDVFETVNLDPRLGMMHLFTDETL